VKFGAKRVEPFITIDAPSLPDRDGAAQEPIEVLRKRLATEWIDFLREQAIKGGKKPASAEFLQETDSFVEWVRAVPEAPLRRWVAERDAEEKKARMHAGCDAICRLYADINGRAREVTLSELEHNDGYKKLSEADQFMARYLIENLQRQNADGLWILSNRN
jgi:hypothetical protein